MRITSFAFAAAALLLAAACGGRIADEASSSGSRAGPSGSPAVDTTPGRPPAPPSRDVDATVVGPDAGADPCHLLTAPEGGTSCLGFHLARPVCQFKPILDGWYCSCDVKEGAGDPGAGPEKAIWVCEPFPFPDP